MSPITTPLLDRVRYPADLRNFSHEQLRMLAAFFLFLAPIP